MRTVIFDLDGTLADTSGDLIAAANACFRAMGADDQLDPLKDAGTALRGGRAMLKLGFSRLGHGGDAEIDAQYPVLLDAYEAAIDRHTVLYPGAMAAVEALASAGFRVGICTNKPERLADLLLRRLGIRSAFGSLVGGDTLRVRKPDPAPYRLSVEQAGGAVARSMLIGDTETDRNTGLSAGVPVALVTFGPDSSDVTALRPEALLHDFAELPELAARFLPAG